MDQDGNQYNVTFSNHMKNGKGIWTLPDGRFVEGTWIHGLLEGFASMTYPSGDVCYYEYEKGQVVNKRECT